MLIYKVSIAHFLVDGISQPDTLAELKKLLVTKYNSDDVLYLQEEKTFTSLKTVMNELLKEGCEIVWDVSRVEIYSHEDIAEQLNQMRSKK